MGDWGTGLNNYSIVSDGIEEALPNKEKAKLTFNKRENGLGRVNMEQNSEKWKEKYKVMTKC